MHPNLRKLDKGQSIGFLIDSDTEKLMRGALGLREDDEITIEEIIRFTTLNQAEQKEKDIEVWFTSQDQAESVSKGEKKKNISMKELSCFLLC